jgi:putative nucleotidyltransferase with HDIG domain
MTQRAKTTQSEARFVDIDALRIGMFIFLDLGWMQHPFALNSFKITSPEQIDTLRGLGVNRVRWSPEKSDPDPATVMDQGSAPEKVGAGETATAEHQAVLEAVAAEAEMRRQQRARLNSQSERLEVCEKQFSVAARTYRQVVDCVRSQPERARAEAEQTVNGMVGKMLLQEETAIRLLSENAGDKTSLHVLNVTVISLLLGRAMGLDAEALTHLGTGALLHDIGKLELPDRLRWRDNQFSAAETKLFQEHVPRGVAIGQTMKLPAGQLAIIAQHHELANGRGFPQQLSGNAINPLARIVALVDQYDILCNSPNPADAVTPHEALSLIFAQMKKQFDSNVLTHFIRMMGVYPPGSVVELSDGRLGLVVSVNSSRPLKPSVFIHDPRVPRDEALVEDLESLPDLCIRRSLKPIQLPKAAFDYLSPRQRMCYFFERARFATEGDIP